MTLPPFFTDMDILNYKASEIYRTDKLRSELCALYFELFNETLRTTCENCIADGLFKIKYYFRNKKNTKMKEESKCNFKLKDGDVLTIQAWNMHISNENLTDELAIKILKISKKMRTRFTEVPSNLDELMGWTDKPVAKKVEEIKPKLENVPTVESFLQLSKPELIELVKSYKKKVDFKESDTKEVIAKAYVDKLILDAE